MAVEHGQRKVALQVTAFMHNNEKLHCLLKSGLESIASFRVERAMRTMSFITRDISMKAIFVLPLNGSENYL